MKKSHQILGITYERQEPNPIVLLSLTFPDPFIFGFRSSSTVVDIKLDCQSGVTRSFPCFSGVVDENLNQGPSPYGLVVGGILNLSSLTHYFWVHRESSSFVDLLGSKLLPSVPKPNAV